VSLRDDEHLDFLGRSRFKEGSSFTKASHNAGISTWRARRGSINGRRNRFGSKSVRFIFSLSFVFCLVLLALSISEGSCFVGGRGEAFLKTVKGGKQFWLRIGVCVL
jgi:hypothetical protein